MRLATKAVAKRTAQTCVGRCDDFAQCVLIANLQPLLKSLDVVWIVEPAGKRRGGGFCRGGKRDVRKVYRLILRIKPRLRRQINPVALLGGGTRRRQPKAKDDLVARRVNLRV